MYPQIVARYLLEKIINLGLISALILKLLVATRVQGVHYDLQEITLWASTVNYIK